MTKDDQNFPGTSNPSPPPPPPPPHPQYGTFQGVANYPPPRLPEPAIGFPHPNPPPGAYDPPGYQTVPGYAVAEGRPVRERRLPCCGIGCGWFLFIIGFFLGAIPWYVGLLVLLCRRSLDYREKPGLIACTVAAIIATIVIIVGATKGTHTRCLLPYTWNSCRHMAYYVRQG